MAKASDSMVPNSINSVIKNNYGNGHYNPNKKNNYLKNSEEGLEIFMNLQSALLFSKDPLEVLKSLNSNNNYYDKALPVTPTTTATDDTESASTTKSTTYNPNPLDKKTERNTDSNHKNNDRESNNAKYYSLFETPTPSSRETPSKNENDAILLDFFDSFNKESNPTKNDHQWLSESPIFSVGKRTTIDTSSFSSSPSTISNSEYTNNRLLNYSKSKVNHSIFVSKTRIMTEPDLGLGLELKNKDIDNEPTNSKECISSSSNELQTSPFTNLKLDSEKENFNPCTNAKISFSRNTSMNNLNNDQFLLSPTNGIYAIRNTNDNYHFEPCTFKNNLIGINNNNHPDYNNNINTNVNKSLNFISKDELYDKFTFRNFNIMDNNYYNHQTNQTINTNLMTFSQRFSMNNVIEKTNNNNYNNNNSINDLSHNFLKNEPTLYFKEDYDDDDDDYYYIYKSSTGGFYKSECDHVFCLDCIKVWRRTDSVSRELNRKCPICQKVSLHFIPSDIYCHSGPLKSHIIERFRGRCSRIPCRFYEKRGPYNTHNCPFGNESLKQNVQKG
ncbi:hypothetical protein U3516DRAFT_845671 [Neocallimastix sp. 'constans']